MEQIVESVQVCDSPVILGFCWKNDKEKKSLDKFLRASEHTQKIKFEL